VESWHHHQFKGKVEIVENCLENDGLKQKNKVGTAVGARRASPWRKVPSRDS
ncbi:hypothetical protein A2U01_0086341, partial [Trifolium medium]|nr:hypothetical protein [Trifolium medium]